MPAPPLVPRPGWVPVNPFPALASVRSFVSGDPGGERMRVAYFRRPDAATLYARAWFGPGAEGPPRHVHGGAVAAVLDEAMGAACWMNGHRVVAGRLGISFLDMVPIGTDGIVEAWIDLVENRKLSVRARLLAEDGAVLAEGESIFIALTEDALRALTQGMERYR